MFPALVFHGIGCCVTHLGRFRNDGQRKRVWSMYGGSFFRGVAKEPFAGYLVSLQTNRCSMVQKSFSVYSEDLSGCNLFVETGEQYMACWCREKPAGKLKAFELFHFDRQSYASFEALLKDIQLFSRLLVTHFDSLYCIWANDDAVCIPNAWYSRQLARDSISLVHDIEREDFLCENVIGDIVVAAPIPTEAAGALKNLYNIGSHKHKFFQLLRKQRSTQENDIVYVTWYSKHVIIAVYVNGALQLIRRFNFETAEDVLYYLLWIFENYNLAVNDTETVISGMLDNSSSTFNTLNAYMGNIHFEETDPDFFVADEFQQYPLHYFTSFCQHDL